MTYLTYVCKSLPKPWPFQKDVSDDIIHSNEPKNSTLINCQQRSETKRCPIMHPFQFDLENNDP